MLSWVAERTERTRPETVRFILSVALQQLVRGAGEGGSIAPAPVDLGDVDGAPWLEHNPDGPVAQGVSLRLNAYERAQLDWLCKRHRRKLQRTMRLLVAPALRAIASDLAHHRSTPTPYSEAVGEFIQSARIM